jgi:hypothetical protein
MTQTPRCSTSKYSKALIERGPQDKPNPFESKLRGFPIESMRNGREKRFIQSGNFNNDGTSTLRLGNARTQNGSLPKHTGSREPIYFHNSSHRALSGPVPTINGHHESPLYLPGQTLPYVLAGPTRGILAPRQTPIITPRYQQECQSIPSRMRPIMITTGSDIHHEVSSVKDSSNNVYAAPTPNEKPHGVSPECYSSSSMFPSWSTHNGTQTVCYKPTSQSVSHRNEIDRARTVWVGGVHEEIFKNHYLAGLLSEFGPIQKILWVLSKFPNEMGYAFVE